MKPDSICPAIVHFILMGYTYFLLPPVGSVNPTRHIPIEVTMRLLLSILILVLLNPMVATAGCSPEKMVKIVFHDATPGYEEGHFATLPKTLYRLGAHHARFEESRDPEQGIHGLIVVNGRHTWMVNLSVKTGRLIVDRAESYDFHAPIIGDQDGPFVEFEFGCELAYMEARGVEPTRVKVGDGDVLQYEVSDGETTVTLMVDQDTGQPSAVGVLEKGRPVYLLRYDAYETGLEPEMSLFTMPADITWEKTE